MTDKLKVFSVVIFATDDYQITPNNAINGRQMEIFLPVDAISHLTPRERENPRSGYNVHLKKNYPLDAPFPIKSYNPGYLTAEQVEILKLS
jgi:hypothetical protein